MPEDQLPEPGFRIVETFDATLEQVWAEWTEPERFADWYGGADSEIPVDSVEMDVREGGTWKATMFAGADRRRIDWFGEYLEVDRPSRLVIAIADRPGDEREIVTVELSDLGNDHTEMVLEQRGGMTPEQYNAAKGGWGGFLARMRERLEAV